MKNVAWNVRKLKKIRPQITRQKLTKKDKKFGKWNQESTDDSLFSLFLDFFQLPNE